MYNKKQLKLLPLSHECFPVPQRPCTILRDAPPGRGAGAIAIILVLLIDRVVFVIVVGWCSWRRGCGGVVMAGLSTAVPLTLLGTATNVAVVVVVVDR